ncbi:MAG: hypothetical protein JSS34_01975 [Proteobacteria bacterium]|nr:hypothetical protein [Pseudomonadota bacterium]
MNRLVNLFAVITAIFISSAVYADLPQVGSVVQGSVPVGHYNVPLPEGSWTVLKAAEVQETRPVTFRYGPIGHVPMYKLVLAQAHQNLLAGIVKIDATATFEADEGYSSPHPITLKNAYHAESFFTIGNARGKPSGMFIEPYHYLSSSFGGLVNDFIQSNHLTVSDSAFVTVNFNLVKHGGFLKVQYIFNPGAQGGTLSRSHATAGHWHPTQHDLWEQNEKSILEHYTQWAKSFKSQVIASLGN